MKETVVLHKCSEEDFSELISEIGDARFLLQCAGPKYSYPLDCDQLRKTLEESQGEQPLSQMFKATLGDGPETVGHIQLMDIDYTASTCVLGRVLIFRKYRGNGYGYGMVRRATFHAFEKLSMTEVRLGVFDFNIAAIKTYKKIGFREYEYIERARQFDNEWWNAIWMKLTQNQTKELDT